MKVRSMRWGYDGGGVGCGPIAGSTIVEICVTANDQHNYFVVASRMGNFEKIQISPVPLFDILIQLAHYDVESGDELEKCDSNSIEDYDYELGAVPEEMGQSRFAKVIHLIRVAMQEYYGNEDKETDYQTAIEFIAPYIDKDLEELELPELIDEEYDEEE